MDRRDDARTAARCGLMLAAGAAFAVVARALALAGCVWQMVALGLALAALGAWELGGAIVALAGMVERRR